MKIRDIIKVIEDVAPLSLQEDFDNAGVQIGNVEAEATGAILCLDITEAVLDEAIERKCNLVISHHPLIFKPLKSITGATYIERCLIKACKHDIVIYSAHTNLDNAVGGVNFHLARLLGLDDIRILSPQKNRLLKLVVYVPQNHAEKVREAIFSAGAGHIGNYDLCSFNIDGSGSFRAGENTHPYCGRKGEIHIEKETRIETILPAHCKNSVLQALFKNHPYEEPAYDLYALSNTWNSAGSGVVGCLPEEENARQFLLRVKALFNVPSVKTSVFSEEKNIRKVALCGGSGAFLIPDAISVGADVFITGEARYNDYYVEGKIILAVIGHYESEVVTTDLFKAIISEKFPTFAQHFSNAINSNPINYI
ncbi:MAG: Nif3-like dinuclear metal center hexameric protein [Tannerellaceae bacterium]|jgi:dinuclear metal center YbgI/SA1388 family protein|nr:Nif3-like dinuclear metal center hexameric protein [Tannerellaceae bacterium]